MQHVQQTQQPPQMTIPVMAASAMINRQQQSNALLKLMQFCEQLNSIQESKYEISYWQKVIAEFFTETAVFKYTINNGKEPKVFELPAPVLPRFYHTFVNSGVQRIQIHLEDSRPYSTQIGYMVDCPRASVSYYMGPETYATSSGVLRVMFNSRFKIEWMEQTTHNHNEYIGRETLLQLLANRDLSTPPPPSMLCPYGVTEQVMRFLQVSETVTSMRKLMNQACLPNSGGPLKTFLSSVNGPARNFQQQQQLQQLAQQQHLQAQQNHLKQQLTKQSNGESQPGNDKIKQEMFDTGNVGQAMSPPPNDQVAANGQSGQMAGPGKSFSYPSQQAQHPQASGGGATPNPHRNSVGSQDHAYTSGMNGSTHPQNGSVSNGQTNGRAAPTPSPRMAQKRRRPASVKEEESSPGKRHNSSKAAKK